MMLRRPKITLRQAAVDPLYNEAARAVRVAVFEQSPGRIYKPRFGGRCWLGWPWLIMNCGHMQS